MAYPILASKLVTYSTSLSKCFNCEPPPVITIPAFNFFSKPELLISKRTVSKISSTRACITIAKFFTLTSFGGRPWKLGILTISFSLFSSDKAEPNFTFSASAWLRRTLHPSSTSLVIILPPKGITAVCLIIPFLKMATSVVPPPISTKHTPASNSSGVSTASEEDKGSSIRSATFKPARSTLL